MKDASTVASTSPPCRPIPGNKNGSVFVGQWAPTLLILGLYNKLVKVAGSDSLHR